MANCNQQFIDFDRIIDLSYSRERNLKISRRDLRNKIRDDFKDKHKNEIQPKFWSQGSFHTGTAINPIGIKDGENILYKYDVDDGIYFIGPIEQRKSPTTYHAWIYDAVNGHTGKDPIDKNTCVRTVFADGHHIDQPIYFEVEGTVPELAHKSKSWFKSDPREFTEWFEKKANENQQLKRLIRYFKSWCDYQNFKAGSKKMPMGLAMTIWVAENADYNQRDDIAMKNTLGNIKYQIDRQVSITCNRPTTPAGENILEEYNHTDFFKGKLNAFAESASQAINESNPKIACGKWQIHFGDRFSCSTAQDKEESASEFDAPAVITVNAKSAL